MLNCQLDLFEREKKKIDLSIYVRTLLIKIGSIW